MRPLAALALGFVLVLALALSLALPLGAQSAPTTAPAPAAPAAADSLQLEQVILISRHGVRSPTNTRPPLAQVAADPWPAWPVAPGELTPHGAQLATIMGGYYRLEFSRAGLLAPSGCPRAHDVFVWSDIEQRTRLTSQAILDGMYPGCGLKPHTIYDAAPAPQSDAKNDPLFHPTSTGVCQVDGAAARNAILGRIGGNLNALIAAHAEQFAKLQSVLKCCAPTLCPSGAASCTLPQLPATITPDGDLKGPLSIASSTTEIFLLEYANALPLDQVAWGRIDEPTLRYLSRLHTLEYDLAERTFYPAQRAGSNLLDQVLSTLRAKITGNNAPRARAPAATNAVLYVGHDTNIANLGGMLALDWMLDGYQANDTPPDGALAFELFRGKMKPGTKPEYFVRLFYYAQSPSQLRAATPLDAAHPPGRAEIALPGCAAAAAHAGTGMACPWPVFERIVAAAIDRECVGTGSANRPRNSSATPRKKIEPMR